MRVKMLRLRRVRWVERGIRWWNVRGMERSQSWIGVSIPYGSVRALGGDNGRGTGEGQGQEADRDRDRNREDLTGTIADVIVRS